MKFKQIEWSEDFDWTGMEERRDTLRQEVCVKL